MRKRRDTLLNSRNAFWRALAGATLTGLSVCALLLSHAALFQRDAAAHVVATTTITPSPTVSNPYLYFVLKQNNGFVLARSPEGTTNQPVAPPQIVAQFDDGFGESPADSVISLQTSPGGLYVAIDGTHGDGELLWIFDARSMTLKREPANVSGTFLNWLPDNSGLFLYRPVLPLGPDGPLTTTDWDPGLWIGNALTDAFTNLDIDVPSTDLIDALGSPDGSQILFSTSDGLGTGSDIWTIDMDGMDLKHLIRLADDDDPQSIAGLFSWSPDGQSIAYERLSDSPTPFLASGLWVMDRHGGHQRHLAQADGGHGFLVRWSPDSTKIAFVARTNLNASMADQSTQALQSSINVVSLANGRSWSVATPAETGVQININPAWNASSSQVTFAAFNPLNPELGGSVRYWSAEVNPTGIHPSAVAVSQPVTHVIALG